MKIFYLMGKSASGKDTVYRSLQEWYQGKLKTVVLYTTRPIRSGEQDGVDYYYITENEVERLEEQGKLIELRAYHTIHGVWKYMTVADEQFQQDGNYLLIGTLESYDKIRKYFGKEQMIPIYLEVETGIRLQRALDRERAQEQPKYAELCRRFLADEEDFSEEKRKKAGIFKVYRNESLEQCLEAVRKTVEQTLQGEKEGTEDTVKEGRKSDGGNCHE